MFRTSLGSGCDYLAGSRILSSRLHPFLGLTPAQMYELDAIDADPYCAVIEPPEPYLDGFTVVPSGSVRFGYLVGESYVEAIIEPCGRRHIVH